MKQIPNINPRTGVSEDYGNIFSSIAALQLKGGIERFAKFNRDFPVQPYTERFPQDQYRDVITDQNVIRISLLNEIVDIWNSMTDHTKFTAEQATMLYQEGRKLVYDN